MSVKELELSRTYVWSQSNKEEEYSKRMGSIFSKLLCSYEYSSNIELFDQHKTLIKDLWEKEIGVVPKNEFLYRIEKILMLFEHWSKTNKWITPLVAIQHGTRYRIHPGRDRWFVMNYLKVPRYHFLVIPQVTDQILDQISGFWPDSNSLSITGNQLPAVFHNYDKTDVYRFSRISNWLNSSLSFRQFAEASPRQRLVATIINKKGP